MSRIVRLLAIGGGVALAAAALVALAAPAAGAASTVTVTWNVDAHTHLAKMGSDVTPPRGSFTGTIDLVTGDLTGNLSLPPAQVTIYALGAAGVADASFVIAPVGPTTGHVDFATSQVTTTSRFDIRVAKVTPHPIPSGSPVAAPLTSKVNLAGSNCRTSTPITVTMGGTVDFVHGGTFSGTYAIPKFRDCKLMTAAINQMVPGGGNTFSATFSPPGTPAPPPAAAAAPAQFGLDAHAVAPTTPVPLPVPEPQVTTGVTGQLPVDAPPGAGTPIPVGNDTAGGTAQLPVSPPNPNGGLLGLLFQTR